VNARYRRIDDLPETIPVFPLTGVLLLPRGQLPLNVFEPRYLAMVDAVMSGARIIGVIQPSESEEKALKPALSPVGCAGRVTSYREADDGRYLITLSGLCRFRVVGEREAGTPFRQVRADYAPFAADLATTEEDGDFPRERLLEAVVSPEHLLADEERRGAEDAAADRLLGLRAEPQLVVVRLRCSQRGLGRNVQPG